MTYFQGWCLCSIYWIQGSLRRQPSGAVEGVRRGLGLDDSVHFVLSSRVTRCWTWLYLAVGWWAWEERIASYSLRCSFLVDNGRGNGAYIELPLNFDYFGGELLLCIKLYNFCGTILDLLIINASPVQTVHRPFSGIVECCMCVAIRVTGWSEPSQGPWIFLACSTR